MPSLRPPTAAPDPGYPTQRDVLTDPVSLARACGLLAALGFAACTAAEPDIQPRGKVRVVNPAPTATVPQPVAPMPGDTLPPAPPATAAAIPDGDEPATPARPATAPAPRIRMGGAAKPPVTAPPATAPAPRPMLPPPGVPPITAPPTTAPAPR